MFGFSVGDDVEASDRMGRAPQLRVGAGRSLQRASSELVWLRRD